MDVEDKRAKFLALYKLEFGCKQFPEDLDNEYIKKAVHDFVDNIRDDLLEEFIHILPVHGRKYPRLREMRTTYARMLNPPAPKGGKVDKQALAKRKYEEGIASGEIDPKDRKCPHCGSDRNWNFGLGKWRCKTCEAGAKGPADLDRAPPRMLQTEFGHKEDMPEDGRKF